MQETIQLHDNHCIRQIELFGVLCRIPMSPGNKTKHKERKKKRKKEKKKERRKAKKEKRQIYCFLITS